MPEFDGIPYRITRSRRKTTTLYFREDGHIEIRAPLEVRDEQILDFMRRKWHLIKRKHETYREHKARVVEIRDGHSLLLLGNPIILRYVDEGDFTWRQTDKLLVNRKFEPQIQAVLIHWYRTKARYYILKRANELALQHGYKPGNLRITSNKRRWGSCSPKDSLSFDFKLVMAPPPVIDYVILHEMAHIDHKDHSRRFWDKVQRLMPDFQVHRAWLKQHGHLLSELDSIKSQ